MSDEMYVSDEPQEFPAFYVECPECKGDRMFNDGPDKPMKKCYTCNMHGKLLTRFGEAVLDFVRENLSVGFR